MTDYIWDALQQIQMEGMKGDLHATKHEAQDAAQQAAAQMYVPIIRQADRLKLVCHALWSLLQERTGLTEKDLIARVMELDLKDGVRDGKYLPPPVDCPKCQAKMCRKFNRCLFCGEPCPDGSAFDTVTPG